MVEPGSGAKQPAGAGAPRNQKYLTQNVGELAGRGRAGMWPGVERVEVKVTGVRTEGQGVAMARGQFLLKCREEEGK